MTTLIKLLNLWALSQPTDNKIMNNKLEYTIEAPFFPGFYNSSFDPAEFLERYEDDDDTMNFFKERYGEDFNIWDFSVDKDYYDHVGKLYCDELNKHLPDWIVNVKFEHIWSPKEYNFATDELYIDIQLTQDFREKILEFVNKHYKDLEDRIYERWRSRDGFWSHTNKYLEDWIKDIKESEIVDDTYLWYLWELWYEYEYFPKLNKSKQTAIFDLFHIPVYENIFIDDFLTYEK